MSSNITLISPEEAARRLGSADRPLATATLTYWRSVGRGPRFVKLGRFVYYRVCDVDEFLASNVRNPEAA